MSDSERTARCIADIANSIDKGIQVTLDLPEMNSDGRLPVLDLKIWIQDNQVVHSFYKKKVSSPFTILKRSAIAYSVKRSTIFQETIRRISHISDGLPWSETVNHLNEYSNCLRISGYSPQERYHAIRGGIMRYEELKKQASEGEIKSVNIYNYFFKPSFNYKLKIFR